MQIREEEVANKRQHIQPEALNGVFTLENGHCIDLISQNLVEQVFFESEKKFLVVEIAAKNCEMFMLR